jgi:hypothetical protein
MEFKTQFRRAVLAKDVNWIIASMDPLGWQLGDAELSADIYASEFRAGRLDYVHVLGEQRSYREWFTRCPEPWATEFPDSPLGRPGEAYGIRWFSQNCQADTPTIRIRQQGAKVYIKNLTD